MCIIFFLIYKVADLRFVPHSEENLCSLHNLPWKWLLNAKCAIVTIAIKERQRGFDSLFTAA